MARGLAATTAALAAFTALVVTGALKGVDDWGIDHVMPALDPRATSSGIVDRNGLWRPFPLDVNWWNKLLDTYNYPASILPLGIIVLIATIVLLRRGQRVPALVWVGAWVLVDVVELLGKHVLDRPAVHWSNGVVRIHVATFDSSYPSGHTARSVVLAAMVAYVWPRLRWVAAAWVLLVPAALVISAAHVISDVVGGMLLGLLVVLLAHAMIRAWTRSQTSLQHWSAESWKTRSRSSPTSRDKTSSSPTPS
jgi:membrane-associated phospholipid phosphatase